MAPRPALPHPIRGFLLDLDGTLLDTEPIHFESANAVLARFGRRLEFGEFRGFIGTADEPFWTALKARFGLPHPPRELASLRARAFLDLLRTARLQPLRGVGELLARLRRAGVPCAVASSSARVLMDAILRAGGLDGELSVRVSGHDDCARSKPHPEVYLAAAAALRLRPMECVAVEDSEPGVASAKAAGAFTVAVPCPSHPDSDLRAADLTLRSLDELLPLVEGHLPPPS